MSFAKKLLRGVAATLLLTVGFAASAALQPVKAQDQGIVVFAAASLKDALDDINGQWQKETGKSAKISYASSLALAKQIEQGAPADVFVSADLDSMDCAQGKSLIKTDSRANILGNRLVLVAEKSSTAKVDIKPGFDLAGLLGSGRLAMGDIASVPAGKYGKAALENLKVWSSVEGKVASADNVRAALLLVSRGEAPFGIVYQTDAAADPNVKIVGVFPENSHPPIIYPIALTATAKSPDAAAFVAYVKSAKAAPLFIKQGFTILTK
jgi:molybdate transport system substrate-binding protein